VNYITVLLNVKETMFEVMFMYKCIIMKYL